MITFLSNNFTKGFTRSIDPFLLEGLSLLTFDKIRTIKLRLKDWKTGLKLNQKVLGQICMIGNLMNIKSKSNIPCTLCDLLRLYRCT